MAQAGSLCSWFGVTCSESRCDTGCADCPLANVTVSHHFVAQNVFSTPGIDLRVFDVFCNLKLSSLPVDSVVFFAVDRTVTTGTEKDISIALAFVDRARSPGKIPVSNQDWSHNGLVLCQPLGLRAFSFNAQRATAVVPGFDRSMACAQPHRQFTLPEICTKTMAFLSLLPTLFEQSFRLLPRDSRITPRVESVRFHDDVPREDWVAKVHGGISVHRVKNILRNCHLRKETTNANRQSPCLLPFPMTLSTLRDGVNAFRLCFRRRQDWSHHTQTRELYHHLHQCRIAQYCDPMIDLSAQTRVNCPVPHVRPGSLETRSSFRLAPSDNCQYEAWCNIWVLHSSPCRSVRHTSSIHQSTSYSCVSFACKSVSDSDECSSTAHLICSPCCA